MAALPIAIPEETLDALAARVAEIVLARIEAPEPASEWLDSGGAACHLGVSTKRIYDLRSQRSLEPDGYDGRTPLYRRESLDAYARSARPLTRR